MFDGINDYLELKNNLVNISFSPIAINFWINSFNFTETEDTDFIGYPVLEYGNLFIEIGSNYVPEWNIEQNYKENDTIKYENIFYKLTSAVSKGEIPNFNPEIWQEYIPRLDEFSL